ncbi:MAG: anti-sigma factor family protein [Planctomycetia bacterium]
MREPAACPPGEDLSAYALGEGSAERRAGLARHLLACGACRAACEDDQRLVLGLRALGAARSLPAPAEHRPVAAAATAPGPATSPRLRRALAVVPPLAAALLVGLALLLPRRGEQGPAAAVRPEPSAAGLPPHAQHLLATQRPDGSWPGEAGVAGADDRTSTALALLALDTLPQHAEASLSAARAKGLALLARSVGPTGQGARREATPTQALLLAALCGPGAPGLAPATQPAAQALLHVLLQRASEGLLEAAALPWVAYALSRAEGCDLPGSERLRASLPREALDAPAAVPGALAWVGAVPGQAVQPAEGVPCTPLRTALEVLRAEPPLRGLALGPACRMPLLARAP